MWILFSPALLKYPYIAIFIFIPYSYDILHFQVINIFWAMREALRQIKYSKFEFFRTKLNVWYIVNFNVCWSEFCFLEKRPLWGLQSFFTLPNPCLSLLPLFVSYFREVEFSPLFQVWSHQFKSWLLLIYFSPRPLVTQYLCLPFRNSHGHLFLPFGL